MAEVMNSLFGMTPESIQAQRNAALEAQALKYAELDPYQRATMGIYKGANQLGGAIGGLLGVQDPELMRVTQRQALLQQTQPTDAEGWSSLGSRLMQAGDVQGAQEAYAKAQTLKNSAIKNALDTSTMASNLATAAGRQFDISPEGRAQELLKSAKFESTSVAAYIAGTGPLVPIDKFTKPQADFIAKAVELGYGEKPNYGGYTKEQTAKVNAALFNEDLTKKATGAPRTTVLNQQESEFAKERGKLQAKSLSEAETQAKASANAVNRLASMEKLNRGDLITGPLAGTAIGAGQFLSSLGLLSPDSAKTLASSEIYDKQAKDLVMQDLGGKLGAQISNADREFIEARIPQLRNSQPARTELIGKLKEIHRKNIDYYQRMSKYATSKGNLNDFDFASGAPDNTESPKPPVATKRFNPATGKLEVIGGQ